MWSSITRRHAILCYRVGRRVRLSLYILELAVDNAIFIRKVCFTVPVKVTSKRFHCILCHLQKPHKYTETNRTCDEQMKERLRPPSEAYGIHPEAAAICPGRFPGDRGRWGALEACPAGDPPKPASIIEKILKRELN